MKVYAVRNRDTGELNKKYGTSNPFYLRKSDANAVRNYNNTTWRTDSHNWETVSSELDWEVEE